MKKLKICVPKIEAFKDKLLNERVVWAKLQGKNFGKKDSIATNERVAVKLIEDSKLLLFKTLYMSAINKNCMEDKSAKSVNPIDERIVLNWPKSWIVK